MSHRHQIQGFRIPNMAIHHITRILTQHYIPRKDTKKMRDLGHATDQKTNRIFIFYHRFFWRIFSSNAPRLLPAFSRLFVTCFLFLF